MRTKTTLTFDLNKKLKGSKFFALKSPAYQNDYWFYPERIYIYLWWWLIPIKFGIYETDHIVIDSMYQKYAEDLEKLLDCEVIVVYR